MQQNFNPNKHTVFVPINKEKYIGNDYPIMRSEWERKIAQWLDTNQEVVSWSSERLAIEYFDPVRMSKRRYYPDFLAKMVSKNGKEVIYLIEVKPSKETQQPQKSSKKTRKTLLKEQAVWMTNMAKFKAAEMYCRKMGWIFKVLTEKQMFNK